MLKYICEDISSHQWKINSKAILYAAEKYGFSYLATDAENWYVKDL
jgi:hypothetical protein